MPPNTPKDHTLPIIDWELGLKLAGNKPELAKDILMSFTQSLPDDLKDILHAKNDPNVLLKHVHKLHGAVSYCGLPRLKKLLAEFESTLKDENFTKLDAYLEALQYEVNQVIDKFAEINAHD